MGQSQARAVGQQDPATIEQRTRAVIVAILAGLIFVWFNFNGLIRHYARMALAPDSSLLAAVTSVSLVPKQLLGNANDTLYFWMVVCFTGVWIFLATVLLLSLVRSRLSLFGYGVLGVLAGALAPALLCWVSWVLWWVFRILSVIFGFIAHVVGIVLAFVFKVLVFLMPLLLVVALIAVLVWAWKAHGPKPVILGAVAAAVVYFLMPLIKPLLEKIAEALLWLAEKLAELLAWLPVLMLWLAKATGALLGVMMIVGIIGCAGQILVDAFRTALEAGKGQKSVLAASFSIGLSIAFILLVASGSPQPAMPQTSGVSTSAQHQMRAELKPMLAKPRKKKRPHVRKTTPPPAPVAPAPAAPPPPDMAATIDRAWTDSTWIGKSASPSRMFLAILPGAVERWSRETFRSASAPIFDGCVLAMVLGLSIVGLLRGVFSRAELEYRMRFYNTDLLMIAAIPLTVLLLAVAASADNQD